MPSHSEVITKFTKSLETDFFSRLKRKPNWDVDEIETEFVKAMIITLGKTIDEIMEGFYNLFKNNGGKKDD